MNLRAHAAYNARIWRHAANYESFANAVDTIITGRGVSAIGTELSLPRNFILAANLSRFYSDELNVKQRLIGFFGFGKYLIRKPNANWLLLAGVAYNNERFFENPKLYESAEALVSSNFRLKASDKLTLSSNTYVFPSITEKGRVRTNFDLNITWDLTSRFKLTSGYTLNHDSKPPVGANSTDYVYSLTFGWEL